MEKTYVIKGQVELQWILIDASDEILGRLATRIAELLMGKHKPDYTPGVAMGDAVVVINASKLKFTPKQLIDKKYYHHSGYPGGLKTTTLGDLMGKYPDRVIKHAVWGMLPHNKLGRKLIKRLVVYAGDEHPHQAQKPIIKE